MRYASVCLLLCSCCAAPAAAAADWLTLPGDYSHDPVTGQRVRQYRPVAAPTAPVPANYRTSGYTHTRSTLNNGPSADNYHRVERWGDPVRPYGEWQRPYRPYSVPYRYWGEPYGGLEFNFGGRRPGAGRRHAIPKGREPSALGARPMPSPVRRGKSGGSGR